MVTSDDNFEFELEGLDRSAWSARIEDVCDECGHSEALGPDFRALQVDRGRNLLVCFETIPSIRKFNPEDAPLGWLMSRDKDWSSLTIIAEDGESWFRHRAIFGFFDRLIDDGYFDDFDNVLFYGAGGGGYAAAAYSVAAPDCRVLALHPQSTLDPERARWDRRFIEQRRHDFSSRFGYAPQMLETAEKAWIIHDPTVIEDAMHASLFEAANTEIYTTPYLGPTIEKDFAMMGINDELLEEAMEGTLDRQTFADLWRARQDHMPYLRSLYHRLDVEERNGLLEHLCRQVSRKDNRPMFEGRLAELEAERESARPKEDA